MRAVDEQELKDLTAIVELIVKADSEGFQQYVLANRVEADWLITVLARVAGEAVREALGVGCDDSCTETRPHEHLVTLEQVAGANPTLAAQLIVYTINGEADSFAALRSVVLGGSDAQIGAVISQIASVIHSAAAEHQREAGRDVFRKILGSGQGWE